MTMHAIDRALERYNLALNFTDIFIILNRILEGDAREVNNTDRNGNNLKYLKDKVYRLRYEGVLMEAVVADIDRSPVIVTFNPIGKRAEFYNKNDIERTRRLKQHKRRRK